MLVSHKWQTMWMESQHCSASVLNITLPSQQANKLLEDLRANCNSPNKTVQLEALKCWSVWISNQPLEDWKLSTVCYAAVRPLLTKKLQPLYKDVDICKMKLSLMWGLIVKVQGIIHLEGPQYILEVFLQACLNWLSLDGVNSEISDLIFQLLLNLFKKDDNIENCEELFPLLNTDIFTMKKIFICFADKLLEIFVNWKKEKDKSITLEIWKHFLEQCELFCDTIPISLWHKIFKITGQICSEENEPVKERLKFLHGCATTLKSVLRSSKFINYGNSLTTPCEALFKKLMDLGTADCQSSSDLELFVLSRECSRVLSDENVAIGGYDLCITVLDLLEDFSLRDMFWGTWCGLVDCYKAKLLEVDRNLFTKVQMKFFRKLRAIAVNFDLDKNYLHPNSLIEIIDHIKILKISDVCFCNPRLINQIDISTDNEKSKSTACDVALKNNQQSKTAPPFGSFSSVVLYEKRQIKPPLIRFKINLEKDFLKAAAKIHPIKWMLEGLFENRFFTLRNIDIKDSPLQNNCSIQIDLFQNDTTVTISCNQEKVKPSICYVPTNANYQTEKIDQDLSNEKDVKENDDSCVNEEEEKEDKGNDVKREEKVEKEKLDEKITVFNDVKEKEEEKDQDNSGVDDDDDDDDEDDDNEEEKEEVVICTPTTRSKLKAERESKKLADENRKRRKRQSFEVLVQEIVRKNKLRKSEKNIKKKGPILKNKKEKRFKSKSIIEECHRNLRKREQKEVKDSTVKKLTKSKADGKLENYFKVITKKTGKSSKKETGKFKSVEKILKTCNEEKDETEKKEVGWKQTSLKTIMTRKNKEANLKNRIQTRSGVSKSCERKEVFDGKSPINLSPFKEVFHDHEYIKMEPSDLLILGNVTKEQRRKRNKENESVAEKTIKKRKSDVEIKKNPKQKKRDVSVEEPEIEIVSEIVRRSDKTVKLDEKSSTRSDENLRKIKETESKAVGGKFKGKESKELKEISGLEESSINQTLKKDVNPNMKLTPRVKLNRIDKTEISNKNVIPVEEFIENLSRTTRSKRTYIVNKALFKDLIESKRLEIEKPKIASPSNKKVKNSLKCTKNSSDELLIDGKSQKTEKTSPDVKPSMVDSVDVFQVEKSRPLVVEEEKVCSNSEQVESVCLPSEKLENVLETSAEVIRLEEPVLNKLKPQGDDDSSVNENEKLLGNEKLLFNDSEQERIKEKEECVEEAKILVQNSCNTNLKHDNAQSITAEDLTEAVPMKRHLTTNGLKPSKKLKLDYDREPNEKSFEVVEKENVEELISPSKELLMSSVLKSKEESSHNGNTNGTITSRALRIIALVPESAKPGHLPWDSTTKVEVTKSRKAPNVDKNSRASKMLALLSETVKEVEEFVDEEEFRVEETVSIASKPQVTTLVSTLKSQGSAKKRKSIRFDDAKNETVLYHTYTPPSQILEEKGKFRRFN